MEPDKMLEELNEKEEKLRNELMELEQMFNVKKEQYLKIQGAIEALEALDPSVPLKTPTKLVAVMIPDEFILWVCTLDNV